MYNRAMICTFFLLYLCQGYECCKKCIILIAVLCTADDESSVMREES